MKKGYKCAQIRRSEDSSCQRIIGIREQVNGSINLNPMTIFEQSQVTLLYLEDKAVTQPPIGQLPRVSLQPAQQLDRSAR
jgi:hypothetical protein